MNIADRFKPQAKAIAVRSTQMGAMTPNGAQAVPVPVSLPANGIRSNQGRGFTPAHGGAAVQLAGQPQPVLVAPGQQAQGAVTPQTPMNRFQPVVAPLAQVPQSGPFMQRTPQSAPVERYRMTLSGQTADGQVWDATWDANFPAGVSLTGPVIQRIQA